MSVVALDGMGGDLAPQSTVAGALAAAEQGVEVVLVGDEALLRAELARQGGASPRVRVLHAAGRLGVADVAREARRNRDSSIYMGMELVKRGEAGAMIACGNTGAALATALLVLGRLPEVERPALAAVLPAPDGPRLLLDAGANAEARASHLVQFAELGAAYMRSVLHVDAPRVGLLSIGEEATKGSSLVQEVHGTLRDVAARDGLRFIGNVEGHHVITGPADIVVTDGFTGNVCLKLLEGTFTATFEQVHAATGRSLAARLGGALLLRSLRELRARYDFRRYGAAPMLGVRGGVFIGHGRSDAEAIANALVTAARAVDEGMLGALGEAVTAPG